MYPDPRSIEAGLKLARGLFEEIGEASFDGVGFTRAAYGAGEQQAHDIIRRVALDLDLAVSVDAALNLGVTLEGTSPDDPPLLIGSHLDAVPNGGNYDGLAGVLAGVATLVAFRDMGVRPRMNITTLAIRGEESAWFGAQHVGSRAMFGTLDEHVLRGARRSDTGRSLREHMAEAGADLGMLQPGVRLLDPTSVGAYLELHIEQGDRLLEGRRPLGIVTGIRGNVRCRSITCRGTYGHSGTVARRDRHDAVFAVSELVTRMDALWRQIEEIEKEDLVVTFGRFMTDPASHSVTTVPGFVETSFDARSTSASVLARVTEALRRDISDIGMARGVGFEFTPLTGDRPVEMDRAMGQALFRGCAALGIETMPIVSGAGHDAGDFAEAGVPAAMIFIRSENGSHNPREHMEFDDFAKGVELAVWFASEMSAGGI